MAAVGIGAAGFVAADRATVVFAPHLSWRDEPLRGGLQQRVPVPIFVDNDANAAAWAEWRFGAAQGETHVDDGRRSAPASAAASLFDGQVQRGRYGIAGEFGHMQVVPGRPPLRVRQPRLLGAVRLRQRPGPRGPFAGLTANSPDRAATCWTGSRADPAT